MGGQFIAKTASKSDGFPPPPSSVTLEHWVCVRWLAGFKNPGSLSVNKTHVDGPPWSQQPMGFCRNSFSPRGCFDLKMLKQLRRERKRGNSKWRQQGTRRALNESPSCSCSAHGLQGAREVGTAVVQDTNCRLGGCGGCCGSESSTRSCTGARAVH